MTKTFCDQCEAPITSLGPDKRERCNGFVVELGKIRAWLEYQHMDTGKGAVDLCLRCKFEAANKLAKRTGLAISIEDDRNCSNWSFQHGHSENGFWTGQVGSSGNQPMSKSGIRVGSNVLIDGRTADGNDAIIAWRVEKITPTERDFRWVLHLKPLSAEHHPSLYPLLGMLTLSEGPAGISKIPLSL